MSITKNLTQATMLILIAMSVASCSTYPNKFKCDDARGLGCTMLSEVELIAGLNFYEIKPL